MAAVSAGLIAGAVVAILWVTGGAEKADDSSAYCDGWVNGLTHGINVAAAEMGMASTPADAVFAATSPDAPPCDESFATGQATAAAEWCEGFGAAYVKIGVDFGFDTPPQGTEVFIAEMVVECQRVGLPAHPLVPGRGVPLG